MKRTWLPILSTTVVAATYARELSCRNTAIVATAYAKKKKKWVWRSHACEPSDYVLRSAKHQAGSTLVPISPVGTRQLQFSASHSSGGCSTISPRLRSVKVRPGAFTELYGATFRDEYPLTTERQVGVLLYPFGKTGGFPVGTGNRTRYLPHWKRTLNHVATAAVKLISNPVAPAEIILIHGSTHL